MVAHGVEQLGMRTFSQTEMAYAILGKWFTWLDITVKKDC